MNTVWIVLCLPLLIQCQRFNPGNNWPATRCVLGDWTPWGFCVRSNNGQCHRSRFRIVQGLGCGSPIDTSSCERSQCAPPCHFGSYRVRKNVNSLTRQEISRLQTVMMAVVNNASYQDVAHFHGAPYTGIDTLCRNLTGDPIICCPHGNSQFLPWHRLLLANMEELLGEPLPYWDWTEDKDVPHIFETISVPLKNTKSVDSDECQGTDRSRHRRGKNITIDSTDLKSKVSTAFESKSYDQFWKRIQSPHNFIHAGMRCDMGDLDTSAYDPVFYLHHANVDRQFAFWQQLQRLRGSEIDFSDLRSNLPPFHRRNINQYEKTRMNSVGVKTLDYKRNLCYEYDTLTFNGMTPDQFLNRTGLTSLTGFYGYSSAPVLAIPDGFATPGAGDVTVGEGRYFVGVILPKKGSSSILELDVCSSGGRCQNGGKVATFGSSSQTSGVTRKAVSSTNYYISEVEVTNLNVGNWFESFARVRTSPNVSPVSPIIIWRPQGTSLDGGIVILAPGTDRGMYGDLLDNFTDLFPVAIPAI